MTVWLAAAAFAAPGVQIQLVAEPAQLAVGQSGTLHVEVAVTGRGPGVDARRPPPVPVGDGLRVAFGAQSSGFQSINGRITQTWDFQYRLSAVDEGTWTVGPVELTLADGTVARANPIEIEVSARPTSAGEAKFRVEAGFPDPVAWEGEVVLYHFRFESKVPGAGVRWALPEFEGLRQPQHGQPTQSSYRIDDPEGVIVVQEGYVPLLATGTGDRDQAPATAHVQVPVGPTDLFGLRRVREEAWATERAELEVRPLPPPPPGFSGLVGDFELRSEVEGADRRVAVGQSVPWRIVLSGDGALEGVSLPSHDAPGASIYESDAVVIGRVEGDRYVATGTWSRVIVPTEVGQLALPGFDLVTFSPSQGRYVTHRVELPTLTVVEGREGDGEVVSFSTGDAAEPGDPEAVELRPIYTWGRATAPRLGPVLPPLLALAAAPGLLVLGGHGLAWVARRRRERAEARRRPPEAKDLLKQLPADATERLVALDDALRVAEARLTAAGVERDPRILELRRRIGRVLFGGAPPDPTLEDDVRALVLAIGREVS